MSLTDLKKSSDDKGKKKQFTVDEFISDSESYAKGAPTIVSGDIERQQDLAKAIEGAKDLVKARAERPLEPKPSKVKVVKSKKVKSIKKKATAKKTNVKKPYRHATFTLSEEVIQQLQLLSDETNLAKSHIIRILVNELSDEDKKERLQHVLGSDID